MKTNGLNSTVEIALIIVFWGILAGFLLDLWGKYQPPPPPGFFDTASTNAATVRLSTAELIALDEDVSGSDCYSCHEEGTANEVELDENGKVILPADHQDLVFSRLNCQACHDPAEEVEVEYDDDFNVVFPEAHKNLTLRHGASALNDHCYNCHSSTNLTLLLTRSGKLMPLTESTELCAGCHGPTYRDWKAGIHGRWNGHWLASTGERTYTGCTSCHDPHAPGFVSMKPSASPYQLSVAPADSLAATADDEESSDALSEDEENTPETTSENGTAEE